MFPSREEREFSGGFDAIRSRRISENPLVPPEPWIAGLKSTVTGSGTESRSMSSISTGTGLISGLDFTAIIDAITIAQRAATERLEARAARFEQTQTAIKTLEATLLTLTTSSQQLSDPKKIHALTVNNSDSEQVAVTTGLEALPGDYAFQAVRRASTLQFQSRGFANSDEQPIGAGTVTISRGGELHRPTLLDALNGGNGVRRGVIRITDRTGNSAEIDLSHAYTADDVVAAINGAAGISVTAAASSQGFVLTDTSGGTASNLIVADVNGGQAALDLGLRQSVSSSTLTGDAVYYLTADFPLSQINDGNGLYLLEDAPALGITLSDGTVLEVSLDKAGSLGDVVNAVNDHEGNGGKVSAALVDGRFELTDLSGGGAGSFTVENLNNTSVLAALGLDVAANGNQITGRQLVAGVNSVLLRNLRGGQGIDQTGQISLTDRTGATATVDLSGAESLDEVLAAINSAQTGGGASLQLTASINAAGTGIEIIDTSGSTASNLKIADVGGSTLAAQLGIAVDAAQDSVNSGTLHLRAVNEATSLADYAPDGGGIEPGSFRITDSSGEQAVINVTSSVTTVGDLLLRINAAQNISVRAELNETGDGIVLIDEAGGGDPLVVEEIEGNTASDLRLLGEAELDDAGHYRIESRRATIVEIEAGDTLDDLVEKINSFGASATASVLNDGSAFNSARLLITSKESGTAGSFTLEIEGLDLDLAEVASAQDALLREGGNGQSGFLIASSTNQFDEVAPGVDVEVLKPGDAAADVRLSRDTSSMAQALRSFVSNYNQFVETVAQATKFDLEANTRGILQGSSIVLRLTGRLDHLVNRRFFGPEQAVRSLVDLGIRSGAEGKLVFDEEHFNELAAADHEAVAHFLTDETDGFAAQLKSTIESLTDPFTGSIALEINSLQRSTDTLDRRIEQMDQLLEARRERLLLEFIHMENILGTLQSQQQALSGISALRVNPAGKGILS